MRVIKEIKFRAWSDEYKKYVYFGLFGTDNGFHNRAGISIDEDIIEQYTGLKDKNGKEIYEGDIVGYNVNFYEPQWVRGSLVFEHGCFVFHGGNNRVIDHSVRHNSDREIIGDIHENKELLK